jgi:hypothetical protein
LKHEIQDLIDNDVISKPKLINQPNVHQNPLPNYQRTPPPNHINFIEVLQEDWVLAIDDEAWDDFEGEEEAHSTSWYVENITEIEEARHLTEGGRNFKPAYLEEDYPGRDPPYAREANKAKAPKETEEDRVLAQLKKTQASISIWGLIMASQKHRDAILEALAGKEVPMDTTPEQVLSIMGVSTDEFAIIFTTKDLPPEGGDHNRALYVTIDCLGSKVPNVLVDNGSSINVCPMRTATKIGLTKGQLSPSSLTVQAYDESIRGVIGTFEVEC